MNALKSVCLLESSDLFGTKKWFIVGHCAFELFKHRLVLLFLASMEALDVIITQLQSIVEDSFRKSLIP